MADGLIVMARPPAAVLEAIDARLASLGLAPEAQCALVAPVNRHQSLSDKHPPDARERLLQACAGLRSAGFTLVFDRISSGREPAGSIHWTLQTRGGKPDGFVELLEQVRRALATVGIDDQLGHSAHITLSYFARQPLGDGRGALRIAPIAWQVDTIELVAAGGTPYRYDTLMRWPLLAPRQAALF